MAALLRSARLLNFSPSGLLQITGASRNRPPLSRLYSGHTGGRGLGVCPRQVSPGSSSASRTCAWPYAGVRSYASVPEPSSGGSRDDHSLGVHTKQAQQFDWALDKLDTSVRRTGRITKTLLQRIFQDICRTGYPSGNQALLLLRSCGSLLPEIPLVERTELAHHIWERLRELGVSYDASHYNAMLKVYLQNEFKFSPTEFLAKMEAANVQPNRVTFQRLIAAYCNEGDIEGASTILSFMKSKDLPITEAVFNSLVTGHARAGDIESAEKILPVMKGAGIEPGPDTYVALLNAYAEKGDMEKIKQTLQMVEAADCSLMDRDFMQVVFTLARSGQEQHVPELVERMRLERGYVPEAMNLCLSLITQGLAETAFTMLKSFPTVNHDGMYADSSNMGNFFLRHCINMDMPVAKVAGYCKELQDSNMHTTPLQFSLQCALEATKTGAAIELIKIMKESGLPVKPHYFWPLLTSFRKAQNTAGVLEVLKGMHALELSDDQETLTKYILPAFSTPAEARTAFQEIGVPPESAAFVASEVRSEAYSGNLANLYAILSSPSCPALEMQTFRGNLITGFRKSEDVARMAEITALLYKDERFSLKPAEAVAYFLYNLIDGMTEAEVQAQEDKLRQYFNKLKNMNVVISESIYRGIRNRLDSINCSGLIKNVRALVDGSALADPRFSGLEGKVTMLEKKLAELKAEGSSVEAILKQLILTLCSEEKLEQALALKQQHEDDMAVGGYAALIQLCCRQDNVEEALNLKRELSRKDPSVCLDASKYLALVKVLAAHSRVEEAVEVLKEMKEKEVAVRDLTVTMLFHVLNSAATKGDVATITRLQDTIFALGLAKPSANLCSPLINAHLQNKDLSAALEACMACQKQYGHLPRMHDIIVALVDNGDSELLQKAMDFVSQERGEMTMLYDLFFAFMYTARYREARKVIETPGLRSRPGRLQWFAEKCISNNQMEALENMAEMTAKLFECDRDEMYSYVLRLCKDTNDWKKAEATWTKMQEENVIPRERTLRLLADVLRANGQEVPFEVPEVWYEQAAATEPPPAPEHPLRRRATTTSALEDQPLDYQLRVLTLCKKGKSQEAYDVLKDADSKGVLMGPISYDSLIRTLLSEGNIEDAMVVKDIAASRVPGFHLGDIATNLLMISHAKREQPKEALAAMKSMLQADQVPSQLALARLVQALSLHGDVQGIQEVEQLMKGLGTNIKASRMLFVNNISLAHIKNGDVETAVETLEGVYTQGSEGPVSSMSYVFRRVLENKDDAAYDKLSAMAERLANHFASYRPATDLFLQLLDMDRVEEAKFLLARCNAIAEQRNMLVSYISKLAQKPGQAAKIQTLHTIMPGVTEKDVLYPYLMKSYSMDKDLGAAKALYEQMQKEGVTADDLTLKRLAVMYKSAGEQVPFTEPPESFKYYADKLRSGRSQSAAAEE